jgi:glycosyltransferase involved in cell wall biosynthesis
MATCAFISFRLGLTDGVSVVAGTWQRCLEKLGWRTYTVAGAGPVDRTVAGLEIGATTEPDPAEVARALADADLVVAENILTIPLNLPASRAVAAALRGQPAVLHHHDPPWQRARFAHVVELPPDDPAWRHVTINRFTQRELAARGLSATTIYNGFDTAARAGDRDVVRRLLGLSPTDVLVAHPVRAITRKNVPGAIAIAEAVGGVYWLPGPAEDGYLPELTAVLRRARCPVVRTGLDELGSGLSMADLYAGCDLVAFPSTWEGFGNPPVEAAIHHRLAAVGTYPASDELRQLGFRWLDPSDHEAIRAALAEPPPAMLAGNRRLVEVHLSIPVMEGRVKSLLDGAGFAT